MSKQPIYNELKRMLKEGEITGKEYGLAIEKTVGEIIKLCENTTDEAK